MSEPNYGSNGWALWRGEVTQALRDLNETQHEIKAMLKERDERISGRIGRVEKEVSGVHKRVTELNDRWNLRINAALASTLLLLVGWVLSLVLR